MGFMDNRLHDIKKLGDNTHKYSDIKSHIHNHQSVSKETVEESSDKVDSVSEAVSSRNTNY